jgi:hypothetical protein
MWHFLLSVQLELACFQGNTSHHIQFQSQVCFFILYPEIHRILAQTRLHNSSHSVPIPSILLDFISWNTRNFGSNQAPQFKDFIIELNDNKFLRKLGTCKMRLKGKDDAQLTIPQPIMGAEDPSAIRTRSLPDQGVYDEKCLDEPIIWFVALIDHPWSG